MSKPVAPHQLPLKEDTTTQKLRVLEDVGSAVFDVVHFLFKKARKLPFPLGRSIGYVEDTLSPLLDPLLAGVEERGLHLLSLADKKIMAASDAVVKHIPLASVIITSLDIVLSGEVSNKVQSGFKKLRQRGVVGCAADAWVKYDPVIRNKTQGIYNLVHKVPGSSLALYVLQDIGSPLVSTVSKWVSNQRAKEDKHEGLFTTAESSPLNSPTEGLYNLKPTKGATDLQDHAKEHPPESQEYAEELATDYQEHVTEPQIISSTFDDKFVNATETSEGSTSEISVLPAEGQNQGSGTADGKGEMLCITPPQDECEEHDEILDLFDTWGLGVKAISPKGLSNLRTLTFNERSERATESKIKSVSFRL